jgi:putative ABC transport system permease protein
MSTLPAGRRPNGGGPARRAMARWAWRLFRREWRQQVLVLALLTVAIAAVIFGATAAYNMIPANNADFGTADVRVQLTVSDPAILQRDITALTKTFGTVDVIERSNIPVPGSVDTIEVRDQDPHGPYGAAMLALRAGRYPNRSGEVAITDHVAELFHASVGHAVDLGGAQRTVVGIVENPADLNDEFALVSSPPARISTVTVLAHTGPGTPHGDAGGQCVICKGGGGRFEYRGATERTAGAALVLGMSTVALLLVGLVATAGFVAVAQRRTRQLGMLAAIGATGRHLKLVMLVNGAAVGVVSAAVGAAVALAAWLGFASSLETPAGHRIDRFDVPWWLIAAGMFLAVATATAAAWWPARTTARVPITDALSARPPIAKSTRRPAAVSAVFAVVGFACLATGVDTKLDHANVPLLLGGVVAIVLAVLLIGPLAIRVLAAAGSRLPIAARLALRDLSRYRARSASALAAIGVGLGIAVAVIVIAAGAEHTAGEGNLSNRQLVVRSAGDGFVPVQTGADVAAQRREVDRIARSLDHASVLTLDTAASAVTQQLDDGRIVRPIAELVRPLGPHSWRGIAPVYVADPELLASAGINPSDVPADADVLTAQRGPVAIGAGDVFAANTGASAGEKTRASSIRIRVANIEAPAHTSVPQAFITTAGMNRLDLLPLTAGWLIESAQPLTNAQLSAARDAAARAGLTIEARDTQRGLGTTRTAATIAGMLLALAILAMTVGLIRSEAGRDLRTLTATGATSNTRRMITAVTAGALALLGVLLGALAAYLALIAGYLHDLDPLKNVPLMHLTVLVLGLPLLATAAGWLVSGREPPVVARSALD